MSAEASLKRGRAVNITSGDLDAALAPLLAELDLDVSDVLTLHVGVRYVSVQLVTRDRRRKVIPGATTRLRFPVVRP